MKPELRLDVSARRDLTLGTAEAIRSNVEEIRIVTINELACTISVIGTTSAISKLQQFVQQEELGEVETMVFEQPALRTSGTQ